MEENKVINEKKGDDRVDHELGIMPIRQLLLKMSVPVMISMLVLALYNVVDSIFVARISEEALSALSLAFPIQTLMGALNIGTNVGVTALISRSLGERKFEKANDYARHGLFLAIIYFIIFALLGIFFTETYFNFVTSDVDIRREGINYLSIITIFSFGCFIQVSFEKFMQATGKSISSMVTQLSGAIFNIIFDPILIFGLFGFPALGTKGAAIATVAGQIFGMFVGYFLNKYTNQYLQLEFFKLRVKPQMIKNIFKIGIPSIIMQSIGSFMVMGLNAILIQYQSAVAVLGIYYKIQSFIFMPLFGLNSGMVPIVSYNYGAKNKERIYAVIKEARSIGFMIMVAGTLLVFIFPEFILDLFSASDRMKEVGIYALRVISLHFCFVSSNVLRSSVMQATKNELYSLIASLIRQIVFLLPSAYILSKFFGLKGIWFCFFISEGAAAIVISYLYKKTKKEQIDVL